MVLYELNTPAGSGKTRACARYADRLARGGQKVLFVQPTKHLITKTVAEELQPLDPTYPVRAIHSDTCSKASVVAEAVAHFKNATADQGEVLFLTHACFLRLSYIERKRDWFLVMDEVPQVDQFEELRLPDTHHLITPHLEIVPAGAVYARLVTPEDALAAQEDAR
ncbi:Type III restriction enzyme, res subunit [Methylobacterium sp. ap11]|uniref:DEAD/DEAH box helicase family protein n=1 Tax=Methylobacterium sp. ap11 TaxID=1761799 RepID=UPI0008D8313A|nr:DEAD/DEAH box helicase family protein [Methylobacterium sp. ap11]SEP45432.1 Type III restriction enzyme, res subunit [Methylobacterium sp. ap11]